MVVKCQETLALKNLVPRVDARLQARRNGPLRRREKMLASLADGNQKKPDSPVTWCHRQVPGLAGIMGQLTIYPHSPLYNESVSETYL